MRSIYPMYIGSVAETIMRQLDGNPRLLEMGIRGNVPLWILNPLRKEHRYGDADINQIVRCIKDVLSGTGAIIDEGEGQITLVGTGRFVRTNIDIVEETRGPITLSKGTTLDKDAYSYTARGHLMAVVMPKGGLRYYPVPGVTDAELAALDYRVWRRWQSLN